MPRPSDAFRRTVDNWHLVALANQTVTEVRQRVTRDRLRRRGTTADSVWVNRRLVLAGASQLHQAVTAAERDARPVRPDK